MFRQDFFDRAQCLISVIGVLMIFVGCSDYGNQPVSQVPLYLGAAYDVSGSVDNRGLSSLSSEAMDRMVSLLSERGGAMAFGLVDEKAFEPLTRLKLVPVVGKLDQRARRNTKNQESIRQFKADVAPKLTRQRDAKYTDINGAIARFSLFFDEPTVPANAERVMIFLSDGIDTGPWKKLSIRFSDDVSVYTVGMEAGLAKKLFGDRVARFEAIDAAIESLNPSQTNGR